jgi:outer membrane receptor for ferrienterochelin and colicins
MCWTSFFSVSLLIAMAVGAPAQETGPPKPSPVRPGEEALFAELPVVEAASLHMQTLEAAPANVTVISAADIRKYGYRTLGEALAGVRGFDVTYDRIYHYIGVHGLSLPGDYNTRFLVMLNGHSLVENVYGSTNFFGQDFGLDMDLVQRIEVVRGPSSALYGSNGMFATINVVTKSPVDEPRVRVSAETDSFGGRKAMVSSSLYLGGGANLLLSTSVFNNGGQTLYIPEFDSPASNQGMARDVDGERGYHTFANLIWRDWSLSAYFNRREKQPPVAWDGNSIFNDRGNQVGDGRDFIRLSYSHEMGWNRKLQWQLTYDRYRYDDRFGSATADGVQDVRNIARGDWLGSQLSYSFEVRKLGTLTLGAQITLDLRNLQRNYAVSPAYFEQLNTDHPSRQYGLFAQQEVNLSGRWKAYLGLRFDDYDGFTSSDSISPRVALVYQQSPKTVYKFVYGHPFRNPSVFEQFYSGASALAAAGPLRPETANTFEISTERKVAHDWAAIVNVYDYRTRDLIEMGSVDGAQQYFNGTGLESKGIEFELSGKPGGRLETTASLAIQHATDHADMAQLANSPRQLAKLRLAYPLLRNKITLSASMQYLSSRLTTARDRLRPVFLTDVTATTNQLDDRFELQFGIRNLLDRVYYDPVALAIDSMGGDRRSVFVKLVWRTRE